MTFPYTPDIYVVYVVLKNLSDLMINMKRVNYKSIMRDAKNKKWNLVHDKRDNDFTCTGCCDSCNHPRWCVFDSTRLSFEHQIGNVNHDLKILQENYDLFQNQHNDKVLTQILDLKVMKKDLMTEYINYKNERLMKL